MSTVREKPELTRWRQGAFSSIPGEGSANSEAVRLISAGLRLRSKGRCAAPAAKIPY